MIQTTTNKNIYLGDGTTRKFAVTFQYETKNNTKQIDLYTCTYSTESGTTKYNNDVQQITTNYDYVIEDGITYVKYPSDAAVSDGASPMPVGTAIIIMRNTPQEQLSAGPYNSNNVMTQLDKLTMISQDIQEQVNRCYKRPKYSEQVNDIDIDPTGSIEQIYEAAHDAQIAAENASISAGNASSYSTSASLYATNASKWAEGTDAEVSGLGGTHSSKNWASEAAGSATSAASSAAACEIALSKITMPLLGFSWFDHLLNDQRWLRADTFSWQSGETYSSVYQHLLDDIGYLRYMIPNDDIQEKFYRSPSDDTTMFAWTNQYSTLYTESEFPENGDNFYYHNQVFGTVLSTGTELGTGAVTPTTETIGSYTITYYLADDGHKICLADQEITAANIYSESGVAWYYILDTTNTRFKLPRTKYGFTGLRDTAGKYVPESLPNITGNIGRPSDWNSAVATGAFYSLGKARAVDSEGQAAFWDYVAMDASRSSSAYQDNAPVQQRATQMYLYFYVGNFSQSATEQTAGLNSELFNEKADIDLSNAAPNASAAAKETIVGWCMPDYDSGIAITYPLSTSPYTCPSDGIIFGKIAESGDSVNNSIYINGVEYDISRSSSSTWRAETICMPFSKGDVIYFSKTPVSITGFSQLYFAPMKGV